MIPVIPAGLEPATYALGKRRSDPAELWDPKRDEFSHDAKRRPAAKRTGTCEQVWMNGTSVTNLPDEGALCKAGAENGSEIAENPGKPRPARRLIYSGLDVRTYRWWAVRDRRSAG